VLKAANTTILKDLNELKENFDEIFNWWIIR
jgi:hypothetical protein